MTFEKNDYPGIPYNNYDPVQGIDESSEFDVKIEDVPLAFSRISTLGNYYFLNHGDCFSRIAYSGSNIGGSKANTHFQGVLRHHDGRYFVFSGGDSVQSTAQVFLASIKTKLERVKADTSGLSTYEKGVINRDHLGYNQTVFNHVPDDEKVIYITKINDIISPHIEKGYWHAGGISCLRNIYVVPLESSNQSKIRIFWLTGNKILFNVNTAEIDRPIIGDKAGAAAICRLGSNRYLVAVWQDGNRNGTQNIDFYLSKSTNIVDGFLSPVRWFYRDCLSSDNIDVTYQNIQFLQQENGQLFLVGSENKSNVSPKVKGDNIVELLSLNFDKDIHEIQISNNFNPKIRLINKKVIDPSTFYNFDAAVSVYINKQKELVLYTLFHYIRNGALRLVEFPTSLEPEREVPQNIHFSRIELYEDENFGGRVFRIYGDIQSEIKKAGDLYLEGTKLKKGFKSIKFQISTDATYSIYSKDNFKNEFKLPGDGLMHRFARVSNINNFGSEIKSARFTKIDRNKP